MTPQSDPAVVAGEYRPASDLATARPSAERRDGLGIRLAAGVAMALPAAAFYYLLYHSLSGLPYGDDYHAVIQFALEWRQLHSFRRLAHILMFQHNEYRLMLENFIVALQMTFMGHVSLVGLCVLGDLCVIPVFGALWLIWRNFGYRGVRALWFMVPASWLLFQLQYAAALNWAMDGLQMIPVILFMLLSCWLLARPGRLDFAGAVAALVLCIATSANGMFMIPIGGLLLFQYHRLRRLAAWIAVGSLICGIYFYHYQFRGAASSHNPMESLRNISLAYGAAFLGSIATVIRPLPAILFGLVLVAVFLMATRDRLYLRNPALYYAALFFFVTALAVSGLRSNFGLVEALGSRYRINATVLSILLYFYLADKFLRMHVVRTMRTFVISVIAVVLVLFTAESDRGGQHFLLMRRERLQEAMVRWERHEPPPAVIALGPDDLTFQHAKRGIYEPDPALLQQALQTGVYRLPSIPGQ